jgi:hypothetical protein
MLTLGIMGKKDEKQRFAMMNISFAEGADKINCHLVAPITSTTDLAARALARLVRSGPRFEGDPAPGSRH